MVTAENGRIALDRCASERFDVILMDVQMPVMDGLKATRKLRELEVSAGAKRVPIIAMTANALKGDREICLASGMDDYVPKPMDHKLLAKKLQEWTSGASVAFEDVAPFDTATLDPGALRQTRKVMKQKFKSYLSLYLKEANHQIGVIQTESREGGSSKDLVRAAHTLKSSSRQIGANTLSFVAATIEEEATRLAKRNGNLATIAYSAARLAPLLAAVEEELSELADTDLLLAAR